MVKEPAFLFVKKGSELVHEFVHPDNRKLASYISAKRGVAFGDVFVCKL